MIPKKGARFPVAASEKNAVSVIVPCYRSAAYLRDTVSEIRSALAGRSLPPDGPCDQILLVNDGSPDGTWDVIVSLCAEDRRIVGINLAGNVGQAGAKLAAVPYIRGDYAVFMDDDGQHPADQIFPMIAKLDEGWHMVYAQFPEMKESFFRRLLSALHNLSVSILTRKPLRLRITSFFALDATAVGILRSSPPASFIGGTVLRKTRRVTGLPVSHRPRSFGTSNYTPGRLLKLWAGNTRSLLFPERSSPPEPVIAEIRNAPPGMTAGEGPS